MNENSEKQALLKEIERLKEQLKKAKGGKKYGLVWEDKPEKFEEKAKNSFPILEEKESGKWDIETEKNTPNILIEGDNFHTASVLNYTHRERIDAIYLDPPYNTGSTDWKYNNDYVDKTDFWRHSKWLSFMEKRLKLAKNLLKPDGIICVTIDDYELPRLWLLMEEIFGRENHLGTLVIRNNPAGRSTVKGVSITHEYALFFGKTNQSQVGRLERNQKQKDRYNQKDEKGCFEWVNFRKPGSMRVESPKMFYPIFISKKSLRIPSVQWNEEKNEWGLLEQPKQGEEIIFPIDENGKERRWRWGIERAQKEVSELNPKFLNGKPHAYIKGRTKNDGVLPLTWWDKKEYSSTAYGTNLLKDIFSELQIFSYPKSIYAVKDCLRVLTENKNAVILDFFAGSGTTGHAVLELNKEDGGNRQFILCTNNENRICEEVTYQRLKRIMQGYTNNKGQKIEGLGGSLKYLKTDFVEKEDSTRETDEDKLKLTQKVGCMLALKENTFTETEKNEYHQTFENDHQVTGIYFREDKTKLDDYVEALTQTEKKVKLYVFSWMKGEYKNAFSEYPNLTCEDIPEPILEVYKSIGL